MDPLNIVLIALLVVLLPFLIPGVIIVYLWINFLKEDVTDDSNIFNPIRVTWFCLTKPHKLVDEFPWIADDEGDIARRSKHNRS